LRERLNAATTGKDLIVVRNGIRGTNLEEKSSRIVALEERDRPMGASSRESLLNTQACISQFGYGISHVFNLNGEVIDPDVVTHDPSGEFRGPIIRNKFDIQILRLKLSYAQAHLRQVAAYGRQSVKQARKFRDGGFQIRNEDADMINARPHDV
jgi:hypothetical protein